MPMNSSLKLLVVESAAKHSPVSEFQRTVRYEVNRHRHRANEERATWFKANTLTHVSVLARLGSDDRDALIAHFRAKELRSVADALYLDNSYEAKLARKRLERVDEIAEAFSEIDRKPSRSN